ncbi:MAG: hypothetical protein WDA75_23015, partial [Candidatus Latescibacterota bacterium]
MTEAPRSTTGDESPAISPFLETMPEPVAARLDEVLQPDEEVRVRVTADLMDGGEYGSRWLVLTDRRLFSLSPGDGDGLVQLPLDQVGEVRTLELVGGGQLEVDRREEAPLTWRYSGSLVPRFVEVAAGIRQLAKQETLTLPTEIERTRCDQCGRFLPEKDGLCPFCIRKWDTLKRI